MRVPPIVTRPEAGDTSSFSTPETSLLVVDDNRTNRKLLSLALGKYRYRILSASKGGEAIRLLEQEPDIDLVLLDLELPDMNGFEFLKWCHKDNRIQSTPVIVNSSLDDMDSIVQALNLDAYDYFTKPLSQQDLEFVLPLKIKNAVNSGRLIREINQRNTVLAQEVAIAGRFQRFLLPPRDKTVSGLSFSYLFHPCMGVGGDFFDLMEEPDKGVFMIVADVTGHGTAPAMVASMLKALSMGYFQSLLNSSEVLQALNLDLIKLTPDDVFVSAFAGHFDPVERLFSYAVAGHPAPLFLSRGEQAKRLAVPGLPLGVTDQGADSYPENRFEVRDGDLLLLYTDGLVEAENPANEQYGLNRLQELVTRHREDPAPGILEVIMKELSDFTGQSFHDDLTAIIIGF